MERAAASGSLVCAWVVAACGNGNVGDFGAADAGDAAASIDPGALFDDFAYDSPADPDFLAHWSVSDYGPATPGSGAFAAGNVTFVPDPAQSGNTLMRVALKTAGSVDTTTQGEVEGQQRFLNGTYASRVRFYNQPIAGPGQIVGPDSGDRVVCAFFAISPTDVTGAEYGELDFQYLPNAGWNYEDAVFSGPTLWTTSWSTREQRVTEPTARDLAEPHVYWMTVSAEGVSYHLDDALLVTHAEPASLPDSELRVMWNVWLSDEQFAAGQNGMNRTWAEDWFFHARDAVLTFAEIQAAVNNYRRQGLGKVDTLPSPASQNAP
jgi:hypothetical protein